ncbi:MAG: hypothetical protein DMG61_18005 [Acidobacteria bacterium]|nr:MAG: hypothetical protein DMG61_18005 [Acidobacteriota bacterium]
MSPFFTAFKSGEAIKIGVCTRDSASAAKYGFDYIEPAAAEIAAMSEDEFRDYSSLRPSAAEHLTDSSAGPI